MIIDAHHHVWQLGRGDHDWPTPDMAIYRDYTLPDLRAVYGDVAGTVLVQTTPTTAETAFMLQVAASSDGLVRGVVGWIDLAGADAANQIRLTTDTPLLVGLRPMLQSLPDPDWILKGGIAPALQAMAEIDLPLDLLIRADQLYLVPVLAGTFPALRMVIDHGAKPKISEGRFQPWADAIARAASHPQLCCKLSGLVTEAAADWTVETLQPFVDHLLECFGPDRLMWGSDWPVVDLAGGYQSWFSATQNLLRRVSPSDRALIMGETAMSFYRLDR